jgi:hydrophobe/amphiphile efflux-1 (HAE1) family protein
MQKLAELCIRRPVFATMLILSITVVGIFSFFSLGVDLLPKVDLPTVSVTVSNPGASAEQIETEITKKVEDAVNTISGIDELRSTSSEGVAQVIASFILEKNGDVAAQEVRDKVNLIVGDLPETAKQPIIQKFDPDAAPIMQIAVAASRPLRDVTQIAKKRIKEQIENIPGVGQVQIVGGADREIHVWVDPDKLRAYNLTISEVANALRQQNMELPGGRVDQGPRELTVRTMGRLSDPKAFNDIAVALRGSYVVKISDIGRAEDGEEELRSVSRLNGEPAVTLVVSKQSGQNTVAVAKGVKARLAELHSELPKDVRAEVVSDQSIFIEAAVSSIETHLVEGSILASIIIFIFLANLRTTLIAAIAIPTSIISTFGLMAAMGYTLNQITMLALTLMVGIVIDDAIIVLENIYRFMEEKGLSPMEAALAGTREIGLAVMATTLSLLAVFVPVGFMGGIVGRFMSSFGLTASFAIAVSLLVSFTLTPMLCSRFVKPPAKKEGNGHSSKDSRLFRPVDQLYTRMLAWSMGHRRAIVAISVAVVLSIVPLFMVIGKNFTPVDDRAEFQVAVRTPEGSSLAATASVAERIARDLRQLPSVTDTLTRIGGGSREAVNTASILVKLTPMNKRKLSQKQMEGEAREILTRYPKELRTSVSATSNTGGGGGDVQFAVAGPDLDKLEQYSGELLAKLKAIPYVIDADTSLNFGKPELRIEIDRLRAADLGVRVADIAQALNTLVAGQIVSSFNADSDQYDVRLRAESQFRASSEGLKRMIVPSTKVQRGWVSLNEVTRINEEKGPSAIERLNRQRQVTLSANILPGGSQAEVISRMTALAQEMHLGPQYGLVLAGASKELGRTGYYFVLAISLSFIFMYMVLAAQFESFIHPITILLTLPLAIPFGILALLVAGQTVNIFSGLGLLLLFGIVKKNAILQIDHTNGLRAKGMNRYEAIIQANRDRLRPILMTTLALVAGMIPLVISTGPGSATNRSIGVLVVGGQTLCLLPTLLAVPVFYELFEDFQEAPFWRRLANRLSAISGNMGRLGTRIGSVFAGGSKTVILLLALVSAGALQAQTPQAPASAQNAPQPPPQAGDQPALPPRVGIFGETPITLQEAIAQVLANNNDIDASRIDQDIRSFDVLAAKGLFDPRFHLQSDLRNSTTPVSSSLGGSDTGKLTQKAITVTPGVSGLIPWTGGTYQFDWQSARQTTDNQFVTLNPQFPASLSFSLVQPLWRGLLFDDNRRQVEIAKKNQNLTDEQFRQVVIDSVTQAAGAYWDLVFAVRNLEVQAEAVTLARRQVESNERMAGQGILAPIEVVEAQTQLATFEQNLYLAQEALTRAENVLKTLMLPDRSALLWSRSLLPVTQPRLLLPDTSLEQAVQEAIAKRPELAQVGISTEINRTNSRFFKEQTKPQVDLVGSYVSAGLAGTQLVSGPNPLTAGFSGLIQRINDLSDIANLPPLPPISIGGGGGVPEILVGGYGQSLSNALRRRFPTAQVGLEISLPLRNRTAEGNYGASLAEGRHIENQRAALEQAIEADVRNSLQAVQSANARLEAARQERRSAEEQYESEQRRFQAGTSTVFLVLQRQTTMISARSRELRAQADVDKAIAQFDRATARTLESYNISLNSKTIPQP